MKPSKGGAPKGGDLPVAKKETITPVADDQNWRSYVNNELKCADIWNSDWGFLTNTDSTPGKILTRDEKIKAMEEELDRIKDKKMGTTNKMYGYGENLELFPMKHLNKMKNTELKPVDRRPPKAGKAAADSG